MSAKRILPIESDHDTGAVLRRGEGAPPRRPLVLELRRRPSPAPRLLLPLRQLRPRVEGGRRPRDAVRLDGRRAPHPPGVRGALHGGPRRPRRGAGRAPRRQPAGAADTRGGHADGGVVGRRRRAGRPAELATSERRRPRALTERTSAMTPSSPLGDPLPRALGAYWRALDDGRFRDAAACFSRDAVYAVPLRRRRRDRAARRDDGVGRPPRALRRATDAGPCGTSPSCASTDGR